MPGPARKTFVFWPLLLVVFAADCATKQLVEERLSPHLPTEVLGDVVRFTLAYNTGAAFSLSFGDHSRVAFALAALAALTGLAWLYRRTAGHDTAKAAAIALTAGGALGNLLDRVRHPHGVVDFIDIGVGTARLWTFNLADVGVTGGALALALVLVREERRREAPPTR